MPFILGFMLCVKERLDDDILKCISSPSLVPLLKEFQITSFENLCYESPISHPGGAGNEGGIAEGTSMGRRP